MSIRRQSGLENRLAKLKVYRTPIGFHDAYVAAASKKAALQAWGSDADLFARGAAEAVDDPALTAEPLASPGQVIRKLRGTPDEQIAAAKAPVRPAERVSDTADEAPAPRRSSRKAEAEPVKPKPVPKPRSPKPDRDAIDAADKAVDDAQDRHRAEDDDWRRRHDELERERRRLDQAHAEELERLTRSADQARDAYDRAVRIWRTDR